MKKRYTKCIFLILIFINSLFALDINQSIIDGNVSTYTKLLNSLKEQNSTNSEVDLEKSLLKILIDYQKNNSIKQIKIVDVNSSENYKNLFSQYIDTLIKIDNTQKLINKAQKKINTIENEIASLEQNSSRALSLELQNALYHKNLTLYKNKLINYQNTLEEIKKILIDNVKKIKINEASIKKDIEKNNEDISQVDTQINRYQIDKEQANLISAYDKIKKITQIINTLKLEKEEFIKLNIANKFLLFTKALQEKSKKTFSIEKDILNEASKLNIFDKNDKSELTLLLHNMEKKYLGTLKTIAGAGEEEIKTIWYQIWDFITKPIFNLNNIPISILKLFIALFIFILGFLIGSLYKKKVKNSSTLEESISSSTKTLIANIGYYIIVIIAFFISLNVLGVKLSSLAIVAGALSVGIGFGLQNIVSNFVSGIILMFERSIKIGDYVQINDNLRGHISDISMRATTVTTNDNIDVIIPNQQLIEGNVINWTMRDTIRRFCVPFGVAYGTNVHKVIKIVEDAVLNSDLKKYIINSKKYPTQIIMTEMADSSVNFELLVWIHGEFLERPKRTASKFLIIIYDALYANGIEIPFPQRDLHIRSVDDGVKFALNIEKDKNNSSKN